MKAHEGTSFVCTIIARFVGISMVHLYDSLSYRDIHARPSLFLERCPKLASAPSSTCLMNDARCFCTPAPHVTHTDISCVPSLMLTNHAHCPDWVRPAPLQRGLYKQRRDADGQHLMVPVHSPSASLRPATRRLGSRPGSTGSSSCGISTSRPAAAVVAAGSSHGQRHLQQHCEPGCLQPPATEACISRDDGSGGKHALMGAQQIAAGACCSPANTADVATAAAECSLKGLEQDPSQQQQQQQEHLPAEDLHGIEHQSQTGTTANVVDMMTGPALAPWLAQPAC